MRIHADSDPQPCWEQKVFELKKTALQAMSEKNWELAVQLRGKSFQRNLETYRMLTRYSIPTFYHSTSCHLATISFNHFTSCFLVTIPVYHSMYFLSSSYNTIQPFYFWLSGYNTIQPFYFLSSGIVGHS